MKKYSSILFALASASLTSSLHADIFVLKDGTKLDAEIISEKSDSYVLSVEVVKGIRDEKTVMKSDVEKVVKSDPSIDAFEQIKNLVPIPTPDLLDVEDYDRVLTEQITPFIENYPTSKYLPKVKEIESTLKSEREAIANGGIKLGGKLITPAERQMDLYDINARIKYNQISHLAKSRAFGPAMRKFEVMEKEYLQTESFDKSRELVLSFLPAYKAQLEQMLDNADEAVAQRETALERMEHDDRIRTERMFQAEEARFQKQLEEAKASRSRWLPVNRYHKKEIDITLKLIDRESERISKLKAKDTIDAGKAYRETMEHLDKNEVELAKESIKDFKRARPPKEYLKDLEDRIKTAEETMKQLEEEKKREAAEEARKAAEEAKKKAEEGKAAEKKK